MGCCNSVKSSAPTMLQPQVRIPSTITMLFSMNIVQIIYQSIKLECEKKKIIIKQIGIGPFITLNFKQRTQQALSQNITALALNGDALVIHWCNLYLLCGAAISQQICLHLPSCGPGFKSKAHHLCFFHNIQFLYQFQHRVEKSLKANKRGIFYTTMNYLSQNTKYNSYLH